MPAGKTNPLARGYRMLIVGASNLQSIVLLLFRLAWGWEMIESGRGHLTHIADTAQFFQSLNIPFPTASAYLSGGAELVGGILIFLGLGTRLISLPLVINFITAIVTASHDNVVHFFSQDPSHIVDDTAFPFIMTSLLMLAFGPGKISIDHLLRRTVAKRHDPPRVAI